MALRTVILRTAHYIGDIWHRPGSLVQIPEEHFDPQLHQAVEEPEPAPVPVVPEPAAPAESPSAAEPQPEEGTQS